MPIKDMWIEKIYIIARKTEKGGFNFHGDKRQWDGFVYFLNGNGSYTDERGKNEIVGAYDMVLLRKGQSYSFFFEGDCEYVTTAFDIGEDNDTVGRALYDIESVLRERNELCSHVLALCKIWDDDTPDRRKRTRDKLNEIFDILRQELDGGVVDGYDKDVDRALEYIHKKYRERFSVDELSRYCSVSSSYLRNKFRKVMGESVTAYAERLRITEAKYMLESGFFDISEIAYLLGYSDVYHFSKRFTTATGVSPGKYKKSFYTKK